MQEKKEEREGLSTQPFRDEKEGRRPRPKKRKKEKRLYTPPQGRGVILQSDSLMCRQQGHQANFAITREENQRPGERTR